MFERKRQRNQTKQMVGDSVANTQERVVASLIQSFPKKHCVPGSVEGALGVHVIPRTHDLIIPKQMSIDAALSKAVTAGLPAS